MKNKQQALRPTRTTKLLCNFVQSQLEGNTPKHCKISIFKLLQITIKHFKMVSIDLDFELAQSKVRQIKIKPFY